MSVGRGPSPVPAEPGGLVGRLDAWLALARAFARPLAFCGGLLILAAASLVAAEVALRGVASVSLGGADELSGYAVAIATSFGLPLVLLERGHVRVDTLYRRLPARIVALLDLVALLVLTGFLALLGQRAGLVLADSLAFGARATTPLATPLWIPQGLWVAGFAFHFLIAVPLCLRATLAFLQGDAPSVRRLAGTPGPEEQAVRERVADR